MGAGRSALSALLSRAIDGADGLLMPPSKDAISYTNQDIDFLVQQRAKGVAMKVIARQLGRSVASVEAAVRRYALPGMKVQHAKHQLNVNLPDDLYQAVRAKLAPDAIPFSSYCRKLIEKDLGDV